MTNAALRGKPDAGNPHVRFDEGEVAPAKPRRGSLLYKLTRILIGAVAVFCATALHAAAYDVAANATLTVTDDDNNTTVYPDGINLTAATSTVLFNTTDAPKMKVSGSGLARKVSSDNWTMTADMSGMTGTFELSGGGVVSFAKSSAFCATTSGTVAVSNGTTLAFTSVDSRIRYAHLRIAGQGCGDRGALDFTNASYDNMQLRYITLDDDARITIASGATMYGGNEIDLNGHDLEIKGAGNLYQEGMLKGEGDVTFTRTSGTLVYDMAKDATMTASKTSAIRFAGGNVQLHYGRPPAQPDRPLYISGTDNNMYYECYWTEGNNSSSTNGAGWAGDITFTGETTAELKVSSIDSTRKYGYTFTLGGKISGNGKINLPAYHHIGRLCLAYPTNTFTGGILFADGALIPLHPESLSDWSKISYPTSAPFNMSDGDGFEIPLDPDGESGWTYEKATELANLSVMTDSKYPRFATLVYGQKTPAPLVFNTKVPLASGKYIGSKQATYLIVTNDVAVNVQWRTGTAVLTGEHPMTLKSAYTIDSPWGRTFPWDANVTIQDAYVTNTADSYVCIGSSYGGQMTISNAVWTSANPRGYSYTTDEAFFKDAIHLGHYVADGASGGILHIQEGAVVSNRLVVGGHNTTAGLGMVRQTGGAVVSSGNTSAERGAVTLGYRGGSHGYYELRNGSLETHGPLAIGYQGVGVFNQFGGTVDIYGTFGGTSGQSGAGNGNGGNGALYIEDGTFRVHAGSFILSASWNGVEKTGSSLNVCGPSAEFEAASELYANEGDSTQVSFINLTDGGTVRYKSVWNKTSKAKVYANFNNGTLVAKTSDVDLFKMYEYPVTAVTVYSGGLTIDTNGKTGLASSVPIAGATGKGIKSITLGSPIVTYKWSNGDPATALGAPFVTIEGDGYGACAVGKYDSASKSVKEIVVTSPGVGYTTATCKLWYGSVTASNLTSATGAIVFEDNANTGSFTKKGVGDFTLKATNTWGGATVVAGGTLKAGCDWAFPTNTAVVLAGGDLDFNGKTGEVSSVTYGVGGGKILNSGKAVLPETATMTISFDDIVAGKTIAVAAGTDLSKITINVTGETPALDPQVARNYRFVTVSGGSATGQPTIVSAPLPARWRYVANGRGVALRALGGLGIFLK